MGSSKNRHADGRTRAHEGVVAPVDPQGALSKAEPAPESIASPEVAAASSADTAVVPPSLSPDSPVANVGEWVRRFRRGRWTLMQVLP